MTQTMNWYEIEDQSELSTPALVIYPDRIKQNIETMIAIAGGVERLRPHVKTHKMTEIIHLQMDYGIRKFKCATLVEAEMCAQCGAQDVLMAYQMVGTNVGLYLDMIERYPATRFSSLIDNEYSWQELSASADKRGRVVDVYMDINSGMNRTGILLGAGAMNLYQRMTNDPQVHIKGLHVYDGHIHDSDLNMRTQRCKKEFAKVEQFVTEMKALGMDLPIVVAGGSPSFPIHAQSADRELSPGTTLLWDSGYGQSFADMEFLPAAVLVTRVISQPTVASACLDLGHKSVASEMPHPRVLLLGLPKYEALNHSEEHLVISNESIHLRMGQLCYAVPQHICPTVALHEQVYVVENHRVTGQWKVAARKRY
ncbi:D-TA family PLP-dependent enzyme [Reichenbachiella agarivorans]|uniref:D-TA family PLP-dependent enzyme n=1 Tax=Reichenbachiella agarivorans TaxID=2979464 RepID=A0ABY6CKH1_9BACT|nr:D-TA family PLP-dependent enzyme [Reichenbachiella agarivorans]UXP30580.1 D-TA family PLP-dependent enzyme [Reichenbachiella agarivorans]